MRLPVREIVTRNRHPFSAPPHLILNHKTGYPSAFKNKADADSIPVRNSIKNLFSIIVHMASLGPSDNHSPLFHRSNNTRVCSFATLTNSPDIPAKSITDTVYRIGSPSVSQWISLIVPGGTGSSPSIPISKSLRILLPINNRVCLRE